ncbi:MAG: V-type ATP synthase subunit D [Proteobacteria bacterium]|nr:V-type ATP synthase subunit D [Pseudomonadota bacterium]
MAERIKLNKVSLREQKLKRGMYERFLPALEARKNQFLMQLAVVRKVMKDKEAAMEKLLNEISSWSQLYNDMSKEISYFVSIKEIKSSIKNVAGLKVPQFHEVVFEDLPYSLFVTPYSFDEVILKTREAISLREELKMLKEQEKVLYAGFLKTSQRINLYEQRLIPECKEAIRKVTVYLQDQQAASVGVAKAAKRLSGAA